MLVAPTARAAQFTIEGSGDALTQHARFVALFASAKRAVAS
jgi:hypothetical protein